MTDNEIITWYAGYDSAWADPSPSNPYSAMDNCRLRDVWNDGRHEGLASRAGSIAAYRAEVKKEKKP